MHGQGPDQIVGTHSFDFSSLKDMKHANFLDEDESEEEKSEEVRKKKETLSRRTASIRSGRQMLQKAKPLSKKKRWYLLARICLQTPEKGIVHCGLASSLQDLLRNLRIRL
ncbi:unnamed protein product [Lepeophtheirus salmonis]|uniref:(salmon louse) hypothetical protein n=1 Tax=Lepeophtheirus salmonis TaxID=72036 RepID=A0A7R8CJ41_LEPSM|nr:unnamed protein product [Lepeophtheirus salmonis]CAF2807474.1 unnamed protein product [Lepeophtheirus salmonis]